MERLFGRLRGNLQPWRLVWLRSLWQQHIIPLLLYTLLSIFVSWPLIINFTETMTASGGADPFHNLWRIWQVQRTVFEGQPIHDLPLLYYPHGANLLSTGLGPVMGIFALPFWGWGPEAAYNGSQLIALTLTAYFMYLLARGLTGSRMVALVAGVMLMTADMCITGLLGHMNKIFLGGMPLTLLGMHYAIDRRRSWGWAAFTGAGLLFIDLQSGEQLIFTAIVMGLLMLMALWRARLAEYRFLLWRGLLLALFSLLFAGPLVFAQYQVTQDPNMLINLSWESMLRKPDLIHFLLPSPLSSVYGTTTQHIYAMFGQLVNIETILSVSWIGALLCVYVFFQGRKDARPWLLLSVLFIVLSLGPALQAFGVAGFTKYNLPIILPYALVTELPGLDFMRVPGRFMMMGYVVFSMAVAYGLLTLIQRRPRQQQRLLLLIVTCLLLIESWPQPWPQQRLNPVPDFYRQIAQDEEVYGVFDLPVRRNIYDSYITASGIYQFYQMTHKKGIASGYLSRNFLIHPVFPWLDQMEFPPPPPDIRVNGRPSISTIEYQLAQNNYRYVTWHKTFYPDRPGQQTALQFMRTVFGDREPLVNDHLVRVYEVDPDATATMMTPGRNWSDREEEWRWAASPATLLVTSPRSQDAVLEITPATMYDPAAENGMGNWALLDVDVEGVYETQVEIIADQTTRVPLWLPAGEQTITLSLDAGNFRAPDGRRLSFAIRSINLQVPEDAADSSEERSTTQ